VISKGFAKQIWGWFLNAALQNMYSRSIDNTLQMWHLKSMWRSATESSIIVYNPKVTGWLHATLNLSFDVFKSSFICNHYFHFFCLIKLFILADGRKKHSAFGCFKLEDSTGQWYSNNNIWSWCNSSRIRRGFLSINCCCKHFQTSICN